jgi:hypothetical protein
MRLRSSTLIIRTISRIAYVVRLGWWGCWIYTACLVGLAVLRYQARYSRLPPGLELTSDQEILARNQLVSELLGDGREVLIVFLWWGILVVILALFIRFSGDNETRDPAGERSNLREAGGRTP